MSKVSLFIVAVLVIALGLLAKGALFTVSEMEQAIVMQFGEPKRVINEPGLSYKLPLVQDVQYYEKRVLNLDPPFETMLLSDQKRVLIDSFVRYQIKDPLEFFKTVRSEQTVRARLSTITNSVVRDVVGNSTLTKVLSEERTQLLAEIVQKLNIPASQFGIQIVDVRFRRTDLPDEVSERVYARMRAEREREAKEFRAEGFEVAQEITANADREAIVLKAEAKRTAEILRGEGEGQRTRTLNDAYGQDADFFSFYRSMQAYESSLADQSTYLVLTPDSDFFEYFNQFDPRAQAK